MINAVPFAKFLMDDEKCLKTFTQRIEHELYFLPNH